MLLCTGLQEQKKQDSSTHGTKFLERQLPISAGKPTPHSCLQLGAVFLLSRPHARRAVGQFILGV